MNLKKIMIKVKWSIVGYYDLIKFRIRSRKLRKVKKKITLVIGHEADNAGGAPLVLFDVVEELKKRDEDTIICLYKRGGELIRKGRRVDIDSYVYEAHLKKFKNVIKTLPISKIVVNTVVCANCIDILQKEVSCPIIWWIHEVGELVDRFSYMFPKRIEPNVKIKCVSKESCDSMNKYYPRYCNDVLYYGCKDEYVVHKEEYKNYCTLKNDMEYNIVVIGQICDRKNQLQVFRAYELLPDDIKGKVKITFVSTTWNDEYKNKFDKNIKMFCNMKLVTNIERSNMYKIYFAADLLLCPSKEDPMPVVITEAMMCKCPILISSGCGQYNFINEEETGFKYDVNDDLDLVRAITKAYNMRKNNKIVEEARKYYISNFSMEKVIFELYNKENEK